MLLEYQLDWIKIVDFLLIHSQFFASANNFRPPSTFFSLYFIIVRFHLHEFEVPSHPSENRSTGLLCLFCQSQLYVRVWRSADATKVQDQPETQHLVCFHEIFSKTDMVPYLELAKFGKCLISFRLFQKYINKNPVGRDELSGSFIYLTCFCASTA